MTGLLPMGNTAIIRKRKSEARWVVVVVMLAFSVVAQAMERGPRTARRPSADGGTFHNPGVYQKVAGGKRYEWIPSRDVGFDALPDGRIRMLAPETRKSFDGQNDCRRFVFDHLHKRLEPGEEKALFGEGLRLADGNYGFAILWVKADSYQEVYDRPWDLTCNPETYPANSAGVDYVYISMVPEREIRVMDRTGVREVAVPWDLQRVSWLPHYQILPHDLDLPPDKGFGITRLLWDVPLAQIYKKATHINYVYSELDKVPASRKWRAKQAYDHGGKIATVECLVADHPMDRDFITTAEMDENFGNHGHEDHGDRAQRVLKGIYQRMQKELGVASPSQTRIYDDYFGALEGYDNSLSFLFDFDAERLVSGLSSQEMARKRGGPDNTLVDCFYFTKGAFDYRNWQQGGYLDSYAHTPEGIRIYNEIYNYERKNMAAPDRRILKFSWSNAEGVNSNMYRSGVMLRQHFGNGDILRQDVVSWPYQMMLNESFWALLLGHDFVLWHSNVRLLQDPLTFRDSWAAGAGKTQWQPKGGVMVDHDPSSRKQPKTKKAEEGQFPNNPHNGETGAFAGAWLVGRITAVSDRTTRTLEYAPFTYRLNGGEPRAGYRVGNRESDVPGKGSLGDARLSRPGTVNRGQANIVHSFVARKPICVYAEGKDGSAAIYHNVYCGLADVNDVTVRTPKGEKTFRAVGNRLHVFYLD